MKQDTQSKFAAILAAQQEKTNDISKTALIAQIKAEEPQPEAYTAEDIKLLNETIPLAKMVSFFIHWSETEGLYDNKTLTTWSKANEAMRYCYKQNEGRLGYTKVKITVKWENGKEITDRIDCSDNSGDFSANRETIGEYLKKQSSVMYDSNLMQGERSLLSFEDEKTQEEEIKNTSSFCAPCTFDLSVNNTQENKFDIVQYSDKAIAVFGNTKAIKDQLKAIGGRFNAFLNYNGSKAAGWIFSKAKETQLKNYINTLS